MAGSLKVFTTGQLCPSIMGLSLDSKPFKMILPMEMAMVLRYMDPVESSQTILLVLMLEILGVILPTAAMFVEAPQPSWAGSGILVQVMMLAKP